MSILVPSHNRLGHLGSVKAFLEQSIQRKTGRQLLWFRVEIDNQDVVVHGRAPSFHVKQLAIRAIMDVANATHGLRIAMQIDVGKEVAASRYFVDAG